MADPWFGVAIAAITLLLVLLFLIGAVVFVQTRRLNSAKQLVWPDLEGGADPTESPSSAHTKIVNGPHRHDLQKSAPTDLVETLRGLLKEEISKALQREGISERLDRLEHKDDASQDHHFSSFNDRLDRLEKVTATQPQAPAWPPPVQAPPPPVTADMQAATLRAAATAPDEGLPHCNTAEEDAAAASSRSPGSSSKAGFGPTPRQLRLPDPPETSNSERNEDSALKTSLKTLQKQLHKRDTQTTELHRQLRQCQEALWEQTLEARASSKRCKDLLIDPSQVPAQHAQELLRLQHEVERVSGLLAEAKAAEQRWSWIAKRQRAFFMQSEKMGQEGLELLRRHPAGEIFLAPAPVCLEGDEEESRNPPWDVGTSHINPYAIDSWPFEPNVLAQKASAEPSLNRLEEEVSGSGSVTSRSEEASPCDDLGSNEELQLPKPPDEPGPPGAYDVEPPNAPHPETEVLAAKQ